MITKLTIPTIYKHFQCVAGDCSDSCCAGWQVDVDAESWEYYKNVGGEFGKRLKSVMEEFLDGDDSDGDRGSFKLTKKGWCPFLNEDLLCDLFTELGEEHLCRTCTNYPRFMEDYGPYRELGLALSCPEVSRLVLASDAPLEYESYPVEKVTGGPSPCHQASQLVASIMERTKGMSIYDNPVIKEAISKNAEDGIIIDMEEFGEGYYELLLELRETAFSLVKNREIDINKRVVLYLDFCNELQKAIDMV
nr:flagellin lysine-N-methylase [Lachnospiraceae bacterium]